MEFGGVEGGGFNTPFNTMGIGDPVPFGGNAGYGSGDLFGAAGKTSKKKNKIAVKKPAKQYTIGEQLPLVVMAK